MNLLERFRKRDVIGMDLGEGCVKFVMLQRSDKADPGAVRLRRSFCYPHPVASNTAALNAFKGFLKRERLEGMNVCCNIEHESLKIRKVDLPVMDERDLHEAVVWKMREVVEGPVENYVIRHSLLEQYQAGETKRLSLLVFAIDRQVVIERENFLKSLGFKAVLLEPTSVSITAAFNQAGHWDEKQLYSIMDLGKSKTVFTVVGGGKLLFSRPLPGFSVSDIEKSCAVFPTSEGGSLSEKDQIVINDFYTQMAVEVQRSLDAFVLLFGKQRVGTLLLCGGGAALPELTTHLGTSLGIKTEVINPLSRWQATTPDSFLFVAATGLALYNYDE